MNQLIDETGKSFGRWTVLSQDRSANRDRASWLCRCECGIEKSVGGYILRSGKSLSCGCLRRERTSEANRKHGASRIAAEGRASNEYRIWMGMNQRCHLETSQSFPYYGGRGIQVCDRWRESFPLFLEDMGERSEGLSIDRIDNEGDYTPENCRWVSMKEQARNRRNNVLLTLDGETRSLTEWSELKGILPATIRYRKRVGWSDEKCLTKPGRSSLEKRIR